MGLGRIRQLRRRRSESSLVRRGAPAALVTMILGLLVVRAASGQGGIGPGGGGPMLVLFPYDEDRFDPTRPPKTAIVRLVDFERLSRLAEVDDPGQQSCCASGFRSASYPAKGSSRVVVETELGVVASGRSPWVWRLPVSGARDIEATLDGQKAPISILPGGQVGELAIPSAGRHVLAVRRSFATESEAGLESLSLR